jgi:hypothetical protein
MVAGKATDHISGRLVRLAVSLMIRPKLRYSDSRKGLAYSALEPKLLSKLLFHDDGDLTFLAPPSGAGG